ncbi:MAG: homocysteine S-methyltransferase [Rhodobacteraceae bacterium]|nr:MAG: homocysteine S-methyltransferase [Paracoccaceae bacterium]
MTPVVLLDGGMGQELLARTGAKPTPLWSAQVMLDHPQAVEDLHLDYIRAGARVITLNAYSTEPSRLEKFGDPARFSEMQRLACDLALRARDRAGAEGAGVRIAGCLPPLEWSYRPDIARATDEARPVYARIVAEQAPHVDLFLCETMAAASEAVGAAEAAAETGKPVWVAYTLATTPAGRLRSGETIEAAAAPVPQAQAILANCSAPEVIGAGMAALRATGKPFGGYANGFATVEEEYDVGGTVDVLSARTDLGPAAYADHAMRWVAEGATLVGGCCETGPAHIAAIARALSQTGHPIVGDVS